MMRQYQLTDCNPAIQDLKVLFAGQNWHGSNATSCKRAFRYLGCDVLDIDDYHFLPQWNSRGLKLLLRLMRKQISREYSLQILRRAEVFRPHLVFVFKGSLLRNDSLRRLADLGSKVFLFYPDVDPISHHKMFGNDLRTSIPSYDCVFTPKSFHMDLFTSWGARSVKYLPYAYDPWCHCPVTLTASEHTEFESDVAFIGIWGKERAAILTDLVRNHFPYKLSIWGNRWQNLDQNSRLRQYIKFAPAVGQTQAKVFAASKIALAFLSPPDQHTARTFEIPAYGAFMLAERTEEHLRFFKEGIEFACFEDVNELRTKIDYYIHNRTERETIRQAGFERVIAGNSYVDRMSDVLNTYCSIVG